MTQPAENLVPLGVATRGKYYALGPVWEYTVEQPVLLPPGRLTGFRAWVASNSSLPQFGTVIRASLRRLPATGSNAWLCKPQPFGDGDRLSRWTDLVLERPLELTEPTSALLELRADPPWFLVPGSRIFYNAMPLEGSSLLRPMTVSGRPSISGLALTAVYDTGR